MLLEELGLPVLLQQRVAPQETTVLLTGETGTGKTRRHDGRREAGGVDEA
jgi:hypothetical protein